MDYLNRLDEFQVEIWREKKKSQNNAYSMFLILKKDQNWQNYSHAKIGVREDRERIKIRCLLTTSSQK